VNNIDYLTHILQQDCLIDFTRPVLIGVSGGPDSLCLLDLMWRLEYQLVVAHLNHGLRSEADADAQIVCEAVQTRGLPFILHKVDISAYALRNTLSVEEAARKVRYQFLFEQALQNNAQAVVVAHTADDQVETVLMHLLRGAGLTGLKGMSFRSQPNPWSSEIALVRPLLGVFREDVMEYCSERGLQPVFDRSNLDTTYFRNRIRAELLPVLETYNINIKSTVLRMAQTLAGDDQVLDGVIHGAWKDCCLEQGVGSVALNSTKLLSKPLGIQRRLVRTAISYLRPGLRDIDFAAIEKVLFFMQQSGQNTQSDLINGLCLIREGDAVWIADWKSNLPTESWPQIDMPSYELPVPGRIDFQNGWHLQSDLVGDVQDAMVNAQKNIDPFKAWINVGEPLSLLKIRSALPGDRFQPLGMEGHSTKLFDFFINIKVPRRLRLHWPLVYLGNEIAWIPGYRISHVHRLTSSTVNVVFLHLFKE
jgi:tRNA(Ile)-lysidine synthase